MLSVYWRRPGVAGEEMQSCPEKLVATRRGESSQPGEVLRFLPMGSVGQENS